MSQRLGAPYLSLLLRIADEDALDLRRQIHSMHKKLSKAKQEIEELRAEQEQLCKAPTSNVLAELFGGCKH